MTLRRAEFSSSFYSANFEVIPARYTRILKTAANKSEHVKKRATKGMEKESICSTHP
jgi:hypothetical protein